MKAWHLQQTRANDVKLTRASAAQIATPPYTIVNGTPLSGIQYAQVIASDADPATLDRLAPAAPDTVEEAVRLDPSFIYSKVEAWVVGFQRLLPNIAVKKSAAGRAVAIAIGL